MRGGDGGGKEKSLEYFIICVYYFYQLPILIYKLIIFNLIEEYVHRVGRTGRGGRSGVAYTFILKEEEKFIPMIFKLRIND